MTTEKTSNKPATKTPKFYSHLSMEEKRKLRKQLDDISDNKKRQLELFEKNFIKPIKEQIALVDKVKKSEVSLQYYVEANGKWSDWLQSFMGKVSEGMKNGKGKSKKTN